MKKNAKECLDDVLRRQGVKKEKIQLKDTLISLGIYPDELEEIKRGLANNCNIPRFQSVPTNQWKTVNDIHDALDNELAASNLKLTIRDEILAIMQEIGSKKPTIVLRDRLSDDLKFGDNEIDLLRNRLVKKYGLPSLFSTSSSWSTVENVMFDVEKQLKLKQTKEDLQIFPSVCAALHRLGVRKEDISKSDNLSDFKLEDCDILELKKYLSVEWNVSGLTAITDRWTTVGDIEKYLKKEIKKL